MADDAKPVPATSRLPVQSFEENAGDRIQSLGLVRETFHGMFTIFRLSALVYNDLEGTIFKPAGFSLAGFRVMFILWIANSETLLASPGSAQPASQARSTHSNAMVWSNDAGHQPTDDS